MARGAGNGGPLRRLASPLFVDVGGRREAKRSAPAVSASTNDRIRRVASFNDLVNARFADGVNAICWERELPHGFEHVASALAHESGVVALDDASLSCLPLDPSAREAVDFMLADVRRLQDMGLQPELNYVESYTRDTAEAIVATDVYSFHVDRAPVEVDTWLCTYHGLPSEGLRNEDARRYVDEPVVRERLLQTRRLENKSAGDDAGFVAFLSEHHFDLHYACRDDAAPWSFGVGHLWRIATAWPGARVPPCIHRAPAERGCRRLLLIS